MSSQYGSLNIQAEGKPHRSFEDTPFVASAMGRTVYCHVHTSTWVSRPGSWCCGLLGAEARDCPHCHHKPSTVVYHTDDGDAPLLTEKRSFRTDTAPVTPRKQVAHLNQRFYDKLVKIVATTDEGSPGRKAQLFSAAVDEEIDTAARDKLLETLAHIIRGSNEMSIRGVAENCGLDVPVTP